MGFHETRGMHGEGLYHLTLTGTPSQNGQHHGEAFKLQIRELAEIRRRLIGKYLKDFIT
jgi:hypothetical protein